MLREFTKNKTQFVVKHNSRWSHMSRSNFFKSLWTQHDRFLHNSDFITLVSDCKCLVKINIDDNNRLESHQIKNDGMIELIKDCKLLKHFSHHCSIATSNTPLDCLLFTSLSNCSLLESLLLYSNVSVSLHFVQSLVIGCKFLKEIFNRNICVTDDVLMEIGSDLPLWSSLHLNNRNTDLDLQLVTDFGIKALTKGYSLRKLYLHGSSATLDSSIISLVQHCNHWEDISFVKFNIATSRFIELGNYNIWKDFVWGIRLLLPTTILSIFLITIMAYFKWYNYLTNLFFLMQFWILQLINVQI